MLGRFHKMHGLGNDFVVIDARAAPVMMNQGRARAIADRKTGIGCDQLILIETSAIADARLRFFNSDGSEAGACGNGTRAAALLIGGSATIETAGGILRTQIDGAMAQVDMGTPRFDWDAIPLAYAMDTTAMPVGWDDLRQASAVNVGNPHIVLFVEDDDVQIVERVMRMGPAIEADPLFPDRVNVNFARLETTNRIALWTWERGTGHTRACGTGACATAVAAIRQGRAKGPVTICQPGGDVTINWSPGSAIIMTGPASHVFTGEIDWDAFGA